MLNVVDKFDSYTEFEPYRLVVRSWILTLRQRHRVTKGRITHSKLLYTSSLNK